MRWGWNIINVPLSDVPYVSRSLLSKREQGENVREFIENSLGGWPVDSKGKPHFFSGIFTYAAYWYCFVTFDDYPTVGRRIWIAPMRELRDFVYVGLKDGFLERAYGSRPAVSTKSNTGYGVKLYPGTYLREWGLDNNRLFKSFPFPCDSFEEDSEEAVRLAMRLIGGRLWKCPIGSYEQISGIDFVNRNDPDGTYEVKCRGEDRSFPLLFVQLTETNTERHRR